eukprot:Polyplicarium_translucidae@DN3239_c0_g1_i1.p2
MKISKKSQSKRQPLKQKYSIEKKSSAHRKKLKKLARKNPLRKCHRKNPGIPNNWPFKQEMLEEALQQHEASAEKRKLRRKEKRAQFSEMEASKEAETEDVDTEMQCSTKNAPSRAALKSDFWEASSTSHFASSASIEDIAQNAAAQAVEEFDTNANAEPMAHRGERLFSKELHKVIQMSDVILQVLDARDPGNCMSSAVERIVRQSASKRLVYLINKIDLAPISATKAWIAYLRKRAPVLAFKAALNHAERAHVATTSALNASEAQLRSSSQVIGASALVQLLKNYCRTSSSSKNKSSITVGIVGYPNVGKSSIINSLKRSTTAAKVGVEPGVTRQLQRVQLDANICLVDAPGVIMHGTANDAANVLRNGVKLSNLRDPGKAVDELLLRCPKESMMRFFSVPYFEDSADFLAHLARVRGKFAKGGRPDSVAAARLALADWTSGKVRYYALPPDEEMDAPPAAAVEGVRLVAELSAEFDVDSLLRENEAEIDEALPSSGQREPLVAMSTVADT